MCQYIATHRVLFITRLKIWSAKVIQGLNKDEYNKRGIQLDVQPDFKKQIITSNFMGLGYPIPKGIN